MGTTVKPDPQTSCRCGGNFEISGPMRIYECKECGASRPKSEGGAIPQNTKTIDEIVAEIKSRQENDCYHCMGTGHATSAMAGGGVYAGPCEWCRGSGRNDR